MNEPYQLLIDIWSGNPNLDIPTFIRGSVAGGIVRINDMAGGHHPDTSFDINFQKCAAFATRGIYFVYNPWVNGPANYTWLSTHLPADYTGRIFADIEVKYLNYSPATYAAEVALFVKMCESRGPISIYTGEWFLSTLSHWPAKPHEYWWAAYPTALTGVKTWEDYRIILKGLDFAFNKASCPGTVRLWQSSGDNVKPPGGDGHAIDVSVFPGTLDELKGWMGTAVQPTPPVDPTVKGDILAEIEKLRAMVESRL